MNLAQMTSPPTKSAPLDRQKAYLAAAIVLAVVASLVAVHRANAATCPRTKPVRGPLVIFAWTACIPIGHTGTYVRVSHTIPVPAGQRLIGWGETYGVSGRGGADVQDFHVCPTYSATTVALRVTFNVNDFSGHPALDISGLSGSFGIDYSTGPSNGCP